MAVLHVPLGYARRIAMRGLWHVTPYRGRVVATAWPRPHKARPRKTELERRRWMQDMILAIKYLDPETQVLVQDQVGQAPPYSRDVLTMLLAGTLFSVRYPDGREILPVRFRRLLWQALDRIAVEPTGPPLRHPTSWLTLPIGPAGSVLTSRGPEQVPTWQ